MLKTAGEGFKKALGLCKGIMKNLKVACQQELLAANNLIKGLPLPAS